MTIHKIVACQLIGFEILLRTYVACVIAHESVSCDAIIEPTFYAATDPAESTTESYLQYICSSKERYFCTIEARIPRPLIC